MSRPVNWPIDWRYQDWALDRKTMNWTIVRKGDVVDIAMIPDPGDCPEMKQHSFDGSYAYCVRNAGDGHFVHVAVSGEGEVVEIWQ